MRKLCAALVVVGLVALAGCHNTSATGGSGTPTVGTFTFEAPKGTTTVKHDSSETVTLKIDKKNFKEDIHLSATVDPADKGVTAEVPKTLKGSDPAEVKVTVKASDKAPDGEYKVKVIGKPTGGGKETDSIFTVKVPKKS